MNRKTLLALSGAALALSFVPVTALGGGATRVAEAIWAHGELYDTVVTPTSFTAPPAHSTDALYSFAMSGLGGQRGVSEAAPGDRDYNGGRWWVRMVVFTDPGLAVFDPDGDGIVGSELTSADEILDHEALGHLEIHETTAYFECPLLPRRGRR